jgi:hypothetical protein
LILFDISFYKTLLYFANSFANCKTCFSLAVECGFTTTTCGGVGSMDGTDSIVGVTTGMDGF